MSEIVFKSYIEARAELDTIQSRIKAIRAILETSTSKVLSTTSNPNSDPSGSGPSHPNKDKIPNYIANRVELENELKQKKKLAFKLRKYLKKIDDARKTLTGIESELFDSCYINGSKISDTINYLIDNRLTELGERQLYRIWKKVKI